MLRPQPISPIPEETARVARAAFPKRNLYLRLTDELGALFTDETFAALFPSHGQPTLAPWRLALVTILQFSEGLSDRQAADAVRARLDWKYLLRLTLDDPGFDASVLVEFRARLIAGGAEQLLLETLLAWCRGRHLLAARGRQRTDSTQVLAAVRALNRVELVEEAVRHALDVLAVAAPDWLAGHCQAEWVDRSTRRVDKYRLPASQAGRQALAEEIGADGRHLLEAVYADTSPDWLRGLPVIATLRHIWVQQYLLVDGTLRWRTAEDGLPPPARFRSSPLDPDIHFARKCETTWVGYKVHVTETCEYDLPPLITHVETTPSSTADGDATPLVHKALEERDLLPRVHIVDTGFLDADLLVTSQQEYAVDLPGPTRRDYHWQAREKAGFAVADFQIDWARQEATCPEGQTSSNWTPATDRGGNPVVKIKFSSKVCRHCPSRAACTRATKPPRRTLTIQHDAAFHALRAARARTREPAYDAEYRRRAGIEGTLSRGVRRCKLRQARYIGLAKTRLQHLVIATALNFVRLGEWLSAIPRATTQRTSFARFVAA